MMVQPRFSRALGIAAFLVFAQVACSAKPEGTITVRDKDVAVSLHLPGWKFAHYANVEKLHIYQNESQQLFFAVSRYKLHENRSPGDELVKEALIELCPNKACSLTQIKPEYWASRYTSGTTDAVVQNWDLARLTSEGEMLVSIVRLVRGTQAGQVQIDQAVQTSLKIERD